MFKLSVVIPTFNESRSETLPKILTKFSALNEVEVVVSDGGSSDNTIELAQSFGAKIVHCSTNSRAQRLNFGAQAATGDLLLFHHPRSIIDAGGIEHLIKHSSSLDWGGFTHRFDVEHPLLSFTSWYSNKVRGAISGILYLDHCIFIKKSIFENMGPIPPVDIFEDTILCQRALKAAGKPKILPYLSKTSAIRFTQNGVCKQALKNQYLKILFYLGGDHRKMNKLYEEDIALNSQYQSNKKK
ncbi:MAG: glycosyltransferase [Bacteriovoracaceae bacterium]